MSVQVKRRREAASFLATFAGAAAELIVDTTNNRVQVHDGTTNGGWLANGMSPAPVVLGMDSTNVKHGGSIQFACAEQLMTPLSGASAVSNIAFPNPCLILGVSCRVITAITGATSFNVGRTGGTANEFGNVGIAINTTNPGILTGGIGQFSSVTVTLTAVGGNFTAGAVRIQLNYILLNPPTV